MDKWADYLISEVNYDSDHLISSAKRHQDTEKGISLGDIIDRLTIASDIKNGLVYTTIYSAKDSWKKGNQIRVFSLKGNPYLRIDNNKVNLDFLGDLPEISIPSETLISEPVEEEPTAEQLAKIKQLEKQIQELESVPEPEPTPEPEPVEEEPTAEQLAKIKQLEKQIQELESVPEPTPSSPRGSLPKESAEELPQQLVPTPEPEPVEEEPTAEQLAKIKQLEKQIQELESVPEPEPTPEPEPVEEEPTAEQLAKIKQLEKQIQELESVPEPTPSSPRGSLPKESAEELPQQLVPTPEPEPVEEEPTAEQLAKIKQLEKQIQELESVPEPTPSSPRGSLPKESAEELPQQLVPTPEPEPVEEEPTAEQLAKIKQLEKQIQELESVPEPEPTPEPEPEPEPVEEEPTAEQLPDIDNLKNRIEKLHDTFSSSYNIGEQSLAYKKLEENLETLDSEKNEKNISNILQKHQKQLDTIEKFLNRKKKI